MSRTRNLKPSFFTNEDLATLPPVARLLFAGLWCIADREGRLEDRPIRIKALLLPYDRSSVDHLLSQLSKAGFIVRYEVDSKRYIQINTFKRHQKPHKQEQPSTIPPFSGGLPKDIGSSSEVLGPLAVDLNPLVLNPIPTGRTKSEVDHPPKPYAIPMPEEKPADSLVLFYKVLQGVPYDRRSWDRSWGRWKALANELLEIFGGDYAAAYQCLKSKGEELTAAGRTWTLNTIVSQADLWRQQHGGEKHVLINRERFLRDVIEQRQQRKIAGLRKISTPGEILHGAGNHGDVSPGVIEGTGQENRARDQRNGPALEPVQSPDLESKENPKVPVFQGGSGSNGDDAAGVDPPGPDYENEPDFGPDG